MHPVKVSYVNMAESDAPDGFTDDVRALAETMGDRPDGTHFIVRHYPNIGMGEVWYWLVAYEIDHIADVDDDWCQWNGGGNTLGQALETFGANL